MPASALTWLIALPLAVSPLVYLLGRLSVLKGALVNSARWLALLFLLACGVPLFQAGQAYLATLQPIDWTVGMVTMRLDGISLLLAATVWVVGTLVVFYSWRYMEHETGEEKYYALLIIMMGSMIGLGCARDIFNMWVWYEAMAISSFMLVCFYRQQPSALEAGFKYLVQSAVGSVFILLGIILVFAETGATDLVLIAEMAKFASPVPMLAAGALFIIGFGVKAALVPLHTWLPDAHSQAPSGISAMLSGVVIETALVAILRTTGMLSSISMTWGVLLLGFGAVNMLLGNLMALRQTQVKRLLAFSSLAHVGYMLIGFGVALAFQQASSAAGGFFHLITHALMKSLAFLCAGALMYYLYQARGSHRPLMVDDLAGVSKRYPLVALAFSIAVLGLGGLPPLAGFMSKWQIFVGGAQTQNPWVILLVVFAGLNSVLSLGYYAPLVNRMYRLKPAQVVESGVKPSWQLELPLVIMAAAVVVLGFMPHLMSWLTGPAAASLLASIAR